MTSSSRDFERAIQKADDGEFLRALIGYAAQRLMDLEVEAVTGAGYGERSPERRTRRNGYRDRSWQTAGRRGRSAGAHSRHVPEHAHLDHRFPEPGSLPEWP